MDPVSLQLGRRLAFAALLLVPSVAVANVPLPTVFAFNLPLHMGFSIFVSLFFLVSILEALVLVRLYKQEWLWSARVCLLANFVSTVIGALLSFKHAFGIIGLGFILVHLANTRFGWAGWKRGLLLVGVLAGVFLVMAPPEEIPQNVIRVYVTLFAAFALSILLESFFLARRAGSARVATQWALGANGVSYVVLAVVLLAINFRSGPFAQRDWLLMRAASSNSALSKGDAITRIEEVYAWERSGHQMRIPTKRPEHSPFHELGLVKRWAEEGDEQHARELLQLVQANYQLKLDDPLYKEAYEMLGNSSDANVTTAGVSREADSN